MDATPLQTGHLPALNALLAHDKVVNLYQLGVISQHGLVGGGRWGGVWRSGELVSAVYAVPGGERGWGTTSAAPFGDLAGCEALGRWLATRGRCRLVVGPRAPSDALWAGFGNPAHRVRFDQRLYVCQSVAPGPTEPVRLAVLGDLEPVVRLSASMLMEDMGENPLAREPELFVLRVRARIEQGKTWVVERDGQVVFVVNVGTCFGLGAQVGGTYTAPPLRGVGLATGAMRSVCQHLLKQVPCVTLHVNEANGPAVRCYDKAGFCRAAPFRLVAWAEDSGAD